MRVRKGKPTELAKRRFAAGRTQEDIAAELKISQGRYSTIENAKKTPDVVLALRIADIFGCKVTDLWSSKGKAKTSRSSKEAA